jgi:hypothetical protein
MLNKPYKERYAALNRFQETDRVKITKNFGPELWDKITAEDLEGVVIKNPNSVYEIGKRSNNWIKLKNYKVCEVLVTKTELNEKGVKIYGETTLNGTRTICPLLVEAQLSGIFDTRGGDIVKIKYLEITSQGKLTQPTKVKEVNHGTSN